MSTNDSPLLQRYGEKIEGVIGCYDRIVITATLLDVAYPAAVRNLLYERGVRCFEIGNFAEPLRESVRENAEQLARRQVEYLPQKK